MGARHDKKQKNIYVTGSANAASLFYLTEAKERALSSSFATATHISYPSWFNNPGNKAFIYQLKLMEQDIDELRRLNDDKEIDLDGVSFN